MNGFDSVVINSRKEVAEGKWEVRLTVPSTSSYFQGHFPAFHLLPAVATVDIVTLLASEILGRTLEISSISKTKFTSPLVPDTGAVFKLDLTKPGTVLYSSSLVNGQLCSKGLLRYKP